MSLFQSFVLGIVQGITEFFPISSSGHLVLFPAILGWKVQSLSFDAFLHLGTAASTIVYFWKDWTKIIKKSLKDLKGIKPEGLGLKKNSLLASFRGTFGLRGKSKISDEFKLLTFIIIGTIPVALAGYGLDNLASNTLRHEGFILSFLFFVAIYFVIAEKSSAKALKKQKRRNNITLGDALLIGLAQAFAIFPGVSRSGFTISTGIFQNLERTLAVRFSFLLSTPIVIIAGIYKFGQALGEGLSMEGLVTYIIGGLAAFFAGLFAISFLIKFLKSNSLISFAIYRVLLVITLALVFF